MDSNSLISVIIPVSNGEKTLSRSLDSIMNQSESLWEVLIVDDASHDKSAEIAKRYQNMDSRFRYINAGKKRQGASKCRNIGITESKGDYIIFLDADDELLPFALEQRKEFIKTNNELDFAVFPTLVKRETEIESQLFNPVAREQNHLKSFIRHNNPWTIMGPIWKRSSLIELGGFDVEFERFQDPEIHTRAILRNLKYSFPKDAKADNIYHVNIPISQRNKIQKVAMLNSCLLYIKKYSTMTENSTEYNRYKLDFGVLLLNFFKKHFFYSELKNSDIEWQKINYSVILKAKDRFVFKLQLSMKNLGLLRFGVFRTISFLIWRL